MAALGWDLLATLAWYVAYAWGHFVVSVSFALRRLSGLPAKGAHLQWALLCAVVALVALFWCAGTVAVTLDLTANDGSRTHYDAEVAQALLRWALTWGPLAIAAGAVAAWVELGIAKAGGKTPPTGVAYMVGLPLVCVYSAFFGHLLGGAWLAAVALAASRLAYEVHLDRRGG